MSHYRHRRILNCARGAAGLVGRPVTSPCLALTSACRNLAISFSCRQPTSVPPYEIYSSSAFLRPNARARRSQADRRQTMNAPAAPALKLPANGAAKSASDGPWSHRIASATNAPPMPLMTMRSMFGPSSNVAPFDPGLRFYPIPMRRVQKHGPHDNESNYQSLWEKTSAQTQSVGCDQTQRNRHDLSQRMIC